MVNSAVLTNKDQSGHVVDNDLISTPAIELSTLFIDLERFCSLIEPIGFIFYIIDDLRR